MVNDRQIGGDHYIKHKIQPWDIIDEYGLDYYRGNAIKYILRNKMDVYEDIEKAIHYLQYWLDLHATIKTKTSVTPDMRTSYHYAKGHLGSDQEILEWCQNGICVS